MTTEKRADWRCHKCKPRKGSTSSNISYQSIIYDGPVQTNQKQQRDEEQEENDEVKRFKNSLSLTDVNNSVSMVKNDVRELKEDVSSMKSDINEIKPLRVDINDIKTTMQEFAKQMCESNAQMNYNLQTAITTITSSITALTNQVSELCESNKEKTKQINEMGKQINDMEQRMLNKTIEIKNITKKNIQPNEVVKTIANSLNVQLEDHEISNSYVLKKSKRVIVEFTSLNKKKELLSKISRHRVDSKLVNDETGDKYIYVNEHLTPYKRRLLWLAKTKAKEANYKFVWIRDGNIYVKKNEISDPIIISNAADIELITSTI
ncbi:uncharacterized protein LOC111684734 [Lucilia cuprina]|uniref:uncharacterized protein LOC111684734 n=1 Tax=Lucilia cuprina TaxID=7375 RepID=UPI001F054E02|nr:uncharacterized protein LOC111684734 [Lucilia cuprina]